MSASIPHADNDAGRPRPVFDDPRVYLAGERTLLAWIRTGIALMGLGFVVARFGMFLREIAASQHNLPPPTAGLSLWIGSSLIVVGILTILQSAMSHLRFVHRLARGDARHLLREHRDRPGGELQPFVYRSAVEAQQRRY